MVCTVDMVYAVDKWIWGLRGLRGLSGLRGLKGLRRMREMLFFISLDGYDTMGIGFIAL